MKKAYIVLISLFFVFLTWSILNLFFLPRETKMLLALEGLPSQGPTWKCEVNSYELDEFIAVIEERAEIGIELDSAVDPKLLIDFEGSGIKTWDELLDKALTPYQLLVEKHPNGDSQFSIRNQ